jgi:hypothetical protein
MWQILTANMTLNFADKQTDLLIGRDLRFFQAEEIRFVFASNGSSNPKFWSVFRQNEAISCNRV